MGFRPCVVALLFGAAILAGCGRDSQPRTAAKSPRPAVERRELVIEGSSRGYRLFSPPSLRPDKPVPLVLALHGGGNTAESLVETTQLDRAAAAHGFVVAYPEAAGSVWNGGFCCTGGRGSAAGDLQFLDQVITDVSTVRTIDAARVYAVGVSAGGVMSYRLGCDLAGRIAGVGSVAGSMLLDDCLPTRPVSVIEIHGTADGVVPFAGGKVLSDRVATAPAPASVAVVGRWAALDGCPAPPVIRIEGPVTTTTWTGCAGATSVRLVAVQDGGHNWFATEFGLPDGAVDATGEMLRFFALERTG
ncbi:MAG: PHB depolymerase family esterase [Acidimicrobiales bacterium]